MLTNNGRAERTGRVRPGSARATFDIARAAYPGVAVPSPSYARPGHLGRNLAIVVVVAFVIASVSLFTIPLPHSFYIPLTPHGGPKNTPYGARISAPQGSSVSGWWSVSGNTSAIFLVVQGYLQSPSASLVENGTSGSFSFTVNNPLCRLFLTEPGDVSGTIWYPLL